jgi:hypothetical protein
MLILEVLEEKGELRFTRLAEHVIGVSQKMPTQTLRQTILTQVQGKARWRPSTTLSTLRGTVGVRLCVSFRRYEGSAHGATFAVAKVRGRLSRQHHRWNRQVGNDGNCWDEAMRHCECQLCAEVQVSDVARRTG